MSVPVIRYAKADKQLRQMLTASLLKVSRDKGELVAAPYGLMLHPLSLPEYDSYRRVLGGLTEDNHKEVVGKLGKLLPADSSRGMKVGPRARVIFSDDEDNAVMQACVKGQGSEVLPPPPPVVPAEDKPAGHVAGECLAKMQAQVTRVLQLLEAKEEKVAAGKVAGPGMLANVG